MDNKNAKIARLLGEYQRAKTAVTDLRAELLRVTVEDIGIDQKEAMKLDLQVFLDGYLIGQGHRQSWRKAAEVTE